nr:hypothetical protein [Tanacetum cinerariifolium]
MLMTRDCDDLSLAKVVLMENPSSYDLDVLSEEVNSRTKIQSHKTRDSNKPVDQKSHTQTPGRQIFTGHKFSSKKNFAVDKKTSHRSDLRNQCQIGFTDDEINKASLHNSSDPALTRQTVASAHNSSDPGPTRHSK